MVLSVRRLISSGVVQGSVGSQQYRIPPLKRVVCAVPAKLFLGDYA